MSPCLPLLLSTVPLLAARARGSSPEGFVFFLLFLAVFVVLGTFGVRAGIRQQRQTRARLAALAERLHLAYREPPVAGPFGLRAPPTVEGTYRNRSVRFFTYTTGSGKNRTNWCAVTAAAPGAGSFTLALSPQNFLTHLGVALGMQDIQVGDPAFDPLFVVKSNDPAYAKAALLPEIRARLVTERGHRASGHLTVKSGEVRYAEIGGFYREEQVTRLAEMLESVCDLAETAEVYRG